MSFNSRFDVKIDSREMQERFVNRIHNILIPNVLKTVGAIQDKKLSFELANYFGKKYYSFYDAEHYIPSSGYDFLGLLAALEIVYEFIGNTFPSPISNGGQELMDEHIPKIIDESETDLEIKWERGRFEKSGAKFLDEGLVNDNLLWLRNKRFASVLGPYEKGLNHFARSEQSPGLLYDVITDMYESLEAMAKMLTGRDDKDLSANRELFISKAKISDGYKKILKEYIEYANAFRHAAKPGEVKPVIMRQEVESFIYLTGLFIRLSISAKVVD